MNALVAFLSPLVLLVPAMAGELPVGRGDGAVHEAAVNAGRPMTLDSVSAEPFEVLKDARRTPELRQVRIEQRVVIRISPGTTAAREQMMADLRRQSPAPTRY